MYAKIYLEFYNGSKNYGFVCGFNYNADIYHIF